MRITARKVIAAAVAAFSAAAIAETNSVTFFGAAGKVGGSCALVENGRSRLMVDCGTFYGDEAGPDGKDANDGFGFDTSTVDALLVTHAHADHAGRVPQLVRSGFRGDIYMTEPTCALLGVAWGSQALYDDSCVRSWRWSTKQRKSLDKVHWRKECPWAQKIAPGNLEKFSGRYSEMKERLPKMTGCKSCAEIDVAECMKKIKTVQFDSEIALGGYKVVFRPVEHIPGSAAIYFDDGTTSFAFSGDLGTARSRTANPIRPSTKVDAVFVECTYGDKSKGDSGEWAKEYERFARVATNALARGGTLWVPAFAMDRTQRVLLELVRCGATPKALYSLSPSGNAMTDLYVENPQWFPSGLSPIWGKFAEAHKASRKSWPHGKKSKDGPKVLLTTSGMMDAGYSYELLGTLLPDTNVVVCIVGYQSPGTPGAKLRAGEKELVLKDGTKVPVRAAVETFDCFSGHGDARENDKWLGDNLKSKIYLIHGDAEALKERKAGLEKRFGADVTIVEPGRRYVIAHLSP